MNLCTSTLQCALRLAWKCLRRPRSGRTPGHTHQATPDIAVILFNTSMEENISDSKTPPSPCLWHQGNKNTVIFSTIIICSPPSMDLWTLPLRKLINARHSRPIHLNPECLTPSYTCQTSFLLHSEDRDHLIPFLFTCILSFPSLTKSITPGLEKTCKAHLFAKRHLAYK